MSQPFEIDTDALGRAEAPFRELAQRLVALSNQVQAQVSSLGNVWGDDKSGNGFVAKYGPARDGLLEAFSSTGDVVTSTADGVRTMAQGYQRTEESNSDASSQLLRHALTARTEGLLTETTTSGAVEGVPAGTMRARRDVGQPLERLQPTQTARRVRADPVEPMAARMEAVRGIPATPATPAEPMAARMDAVPGIPATPATPATPAEPMQAGRRVQADLAMPQRAELITPAVPAVPAVPMRAEPITPAVPAVPVEPRQADLAAPMARMDAVPATPAMPLEPLQATHRVQADQAMVMQATPRVVDAPLVDESRSSEG